MEKDKVITKKELIVRCGWCGTCFSPNWKQGVDGGATFCSRGCMIASMYGVPKSHTKRRNWDLICFGVALAAFVILLGLSPGAAPLWLAGLGFSSLCLLMVFLDRSLEGAAQEYLYRKDLYRDSYEILLACEFCSHLNPPDVLVCQHCSGSLKGSREVDGEIPEWLRAAATQNRRKCTHCDAVYGYVASDKDGNVTCQNCGKKFPF